MRLYTQLQIEGFSMSIDNPQQLLESLLSVTRPRDVQNILEEIGDHPEISVKENFGNQNFQWQFYGDRESNISTINLGSKPGRSLTERITNSIDAVLEKKKARYPSIEPPSPMAAVSSWFGRPASTDDNGLFNWKDYETPKYDRLVRVVLTQGDINTEPTIDVIDNGIGIMPKDFRSTILSLQQGNKIKKKYLAGTYGQGGSATLAFCQYALVVSRHIDLENIVGFTLIKLIRLGDNYKEDAYVYLSVINEEGNSTVPYFEFQEPIGLFSSFSKKNDQLTTGTLIRHYGYQLDRLEKTLAPSPGNLYHLFHRMMFDPFLPFRIIDLRKEPIKDELVTGSRNRLMKLTLRASSAEEASEIERRTTLRHHWPREMVSAKSDEGPTVGIEYWVVISKKKSGEKISVRPNSNEVYIEKGYPIIGTMNGQNQGELTYRILKDLNLSLVSRHIVIHIDVTLASSDVRRNLFSSTREGFREGEILNELVRVLKNILKEDETLYEIERELLDELLKKGSSETQNEVKEAITGLLKDVGFRVERLEESVPPPENNPQIPISSKPVRKLQQKLSPLRTLPYPSVTKFEIVYPKNKFSVHKQDNHVLRIETDADSKYNKDDRIAIRIEPAELEVASKGLLSGGRIYWRLRPKENAKPNNTGKIIATITRIDGSQIVSELPFEVLPQVVEPSRKDSSVVPEFTVEPVDIDSDRETFDTIWDDLQEQEDPLNVAYKIIDTGRILTIYYSVKFRRYREQLEKLKKQPDLAKLFKKNYEIWIGYHAIMQHQQRRVIEQQNLTDEQLDKIQEHERAVVATMQIKQALQTAEFELKQIKQSDVE